MPPITSGSASDRRSFEIEAHEAPVDDFPAQPSQKDGLGRMCKPHWNQYTSALRKAALARRAAEGGVSTEVVPADVVPIESGPAVSPSKGSGGRRAKGAGAVRPEPIRTPVPRGGRKAEAVAEAQPEPAAG